MEGEGGKWAEGREWEFGKKVEINLKQKQKTTKKEA